MNYGFIDTSFWVALFRGEDSNHSQANDIWKRTTLQRVTTAQVVEETWTFLRKKENHAAARDAVLTIRNDDDCAVLQPGATLHEDAWKWLFKRDDRVFSYVDALSFAVMKANSISWALAFDGDFSAAGFVEMRSNNVI